MTTKEKTQAPTILLVEDSLAEGIRFKNNLEKAGCKIDWVKTGLGGLKAAQETRFDLIVLDIELPDIDGFHICTQLKNTPELADIPVIMLTTRDRAEDAMIGLGSGAIDYIPKDPFAESVLLATLREMGWKVDDI